MIIVPENTHWVLVGGMLSEKVTDRFLIDIYYAYLVLLHAKVPDNNIDVLIDPAPKSSLPYLQDFLSKKHIGRTIDFDNVIQKNECENLMVVINGHGNINGLDSTNQLKPYPLTETIHNRENLRYCAVVFGQCFAGIYNYINIIKSDKDNKICKDPVVCFIGASHLNSSISGSASINETIRWSANIFLFHFFQWLINSKDIDGDGHKTLTDAFKYAGAEASNHLILLKHDSAHGIQKAFKALEEIEEKLSAKIGTEDEQTIRVEKVAIEQFIQANLGVSHTNQDPWLLNANKARNFIFDY